MDLESIDLEEITMYEDNFTDEVEIPIGERAPECAERIENLVKTGDFSGPHGNYKSEDRRIDALEAELNSLLGYQKGCSAYVKLEMSADRSLMMTQYRLTYPLTKENLLELLS